MNTQIIDETPAREVARLAVRLKKLILDTHDSERALGSYWGEILSSPLSDPLLRLDILLGFAECCRVSMLSIASLEGTETEEREEALCGLRAMLHLLDPATFGTTRTTELRRILIEEGLVPRLQLAAELSREPVEEPHALRPEPLRAATQILDTIAEIHQRKNIHPGLKQVAWNFSSAAKYVIGNAELFGRIGINKTISRGVEDIVNWHHFAASPTKADVDAIGGLMYIVAKVIAVLELEGHRGFSLTTLVLINAVGFAPGTEELHMRVAPLNRALEGAVAALQAVRP